MAGLRTEIEQLANDCLVQRSCLSQQEIYLRTPLGKWSLGLLEEGKEDSKIQAHEDKEEGRLDAVSDEI